MADAHQQLSSASPNAMTATRRQTPSAPSNAITRGFHTMANRITNSGKGKKSDIIIPIMGPTGVGKSTFINTAVGKDLTSVGHDLKSCTAEIIPIPTSYRHGDNTRTVVFVDTPGFNDTSLDDSQILELIAAWLKESYEKGTKLAGIIYLHEISQARMFGTSRKSLAMFGKLCGNEAVKNVTLATTKWSRVFGDEGPRRETQLSETYWKRMLGLGSHMARFMDTPESAWDIVKLIIEKEPIDALLIQEELVDLQRNLPETKAGKTLHSTLKELAQQLEEDQESEEAMKRLDAVHEQLRELKIPLSRRLAIFFSRKRTRGRAI